MRPSRLCSLLAGRLDGPRKYPWYAQALDRLSGILYEWGL